MGQITSDTFGSATMASRIFRPRSSPDGAPRLHRHDRHASLRGMIGGQHERPTVLEPFDVRGDDAYLGLIGEVPGEVGELEVGLVAHRRPVRHRYTEVLGLENRPALVP